MTELRNMVEAQNWGNIGPRHPPAPMGKQWSPPEDEGFTDKLITLADAADVLRADPALWHAFERFVESGVR